MKLVNSNSTRNFQDVKSQTQMGLDLENTSTIMNLLRNNIYTDPLDSIVRELFSNAVDAHVKANNTIDSVEINIEEVDNKTLFTVRDYGFSMDEETIINIYSKMGKSTKREDNTQQGAWGLGAKVALSYSDHFWIETYTRENNICIYRKWVQYIDTTQIGMISLLEEIKDIKGNFNTGTKISVPIEFKDRHKVIESMAFYLTYTKSKFYIHNEAIRSNIDLKPFYYKYYGEGWALNLYNTFNKKEHQYLVSIYDIPYSLNIDTLYSSISVDSESALYIIEKLRPYYISQNDNKKLFQSFLNCLDNITFILEVPIGVLDVSASRETLQYTKRTCQELIKYIYKMFSEYYKHLMITYIYNDNFLDACIEVNNNPSYLNRCLIKDFKWYYEDFTFFKNQKIFKDGYWSNNFRMYKLDSMYTHKSNDYEDYLKKLDESVIYVGSCKYILCIQDTNQKQFLKYIKHYLITAGFKNRHNVKVLVCPTEDLENLYSWIINFVPQVLLSDLINTYNKDKPIQKTKTAKLSTDVFKALKFSEERIKKSSGIKCFLKEVIVSKEPDKPHYYLYEKDLLDLPSHLSFLSNINCSDSVSNKFISNLSFYLGSKNLDIDDIYFVPTLTRNYKHENWINLLDVLEKDYLIYESKFKLIIYNLFIFHYIKNHRPIFFKFKSKDLIENSLYEYIQNIYVKAAQYLKVNDTAYKYFNFTYPFISEMIYYLERKYYTDFKAFEVKENVDLECLSFYNFCNSYLDQLPLLKYYGTNPYYINNCPTDIDFLNYINMGESYLKVEKKLPLMQIQEEVYDKNNQSEFSKLIKTLTNKY